MIFNFLFNLKFPHASSSLMYYILLFHEKCLFMVIFVLLIVLILLAYNLMKSFSSMLNIENSILEVFWTLMPSFLILVIMVPSLELLYFSDEGTGQISSLWKVKIIGRQWYWSYFFLKKKKENFSFDSYLLNLHQLEMGEFRNCEVDLPLVLYQNVASRLLITSSDVIHSWAVPEFGVKVDAVPGRLNQMIVFPQEYGRFFGFCSELCGVNHSFMPIVVEVVKNF